MANATQLWGVCDAYAAERTQLVFNIVVAENAGDSDKKTALISQLRALDTAFEAAHFGEIE